MARHDIIICDVCGVNVHSEKSSGWVQVIWLPLFSDSRFTRDFCPDDAEILLRILKNPRVSLTQTEIIVKESEKRIENMKRTARNALSAWKEGGSGGSLVTALEHILSEGRQ